MSGGLNTPLSLDATLRVSVQTNRGSPNLNSGDARAPSHAESNGLTRLSKGAVTSGYKPKRGPFFAPTEAPPQPRPAQAPPRQRPAGAALGHQPPGAAARAAQRRPPQVVAPRRQHGAAAVMALIDRPSTSRQASRRQVAPLPPVDAFNTTRSSKVKWLSPIKNDEDLNGRRVLPKASVLPQRSGLAGGRAGRPVPDTREFCARTGISGTFRTKYDVEEEGGGGHDGGVGAETTQLTPEEVIAPARGSLLEHVSDDNGPSSENSDSESDGSPRRAEEEAAAPAASAMSSTAATSLPSPPSHAEPTGLQATKSAEENGDEEQGRKLMMSFIAGNPEEDNRELTTNSMVGAAASEEDGGELGGEEEQGRELMMRMAAGGDTPPPAVSPAEDENDETVPPSPPSAAESDDDRSSDSSSGEDEDDAAMSLEDEPHPVIEWKRPAPVGCGAGGDGGSSGGGSRTNASSPGRSSTASSTATAVHKPASTTRSVTMFSGSIASAPPLPGASPTGPLPLSYEGSSQLPISSDAHQSMPGTNATPAPPNPPPSSGGLPQRVVWRTPRQTAVPAAVTPTSSVGQQQQEQGEEQHGEDSPVELELPSEVVDALNSPAVRVMSTGVPSTSWRQPARAVPRPARLQAQRHVVPPAASTSPPSSVSSAAASPPRGERAEPLGRGNRSLPGFDAYPFRPPDERDSVPQGQFNALASKAKRLAASKARASVLPRRHQREANGRPDHHELNWVPFDGRSRGREPGRPAVERRSTSSRSSPSSRESTSRSRSRSTNASRQRRPGFPPRDEFGRTPRDGHGRGRSSESRGHRDSSNSGSNSSPTGPGGRMAGYRDRGDRPDVFGRDPRDDRGTDGYGNDGGTRGRDPRNGGRGGLGDFDGYRGRQPEKEGGFPDRRSEHNGNRSSSRHYNRDRSRSPER